MKIFFVNPPHYDYLAASLTEGLLELGCEVRGAEASNYAEKLPEGEIRAYAEAADLVVLAHGPAVRADLLRDLVNPRVVFVDGNDRQVIVPPDSIRFKAIFKRELNRRLPDPAALHLFPLPFAAERRYFASSSAQRDVLISFLSNLGNNPLRESVHQRLLALDHPQILTGMTGEMAFDGNPSRGLPIDTPMYREALHRSLISVNVPGAGYDCARFWEILAAGAMLFTYEADIVIPDGFTDGVDYVVFRSLDEFDEKIRYYGAHLDLVRQIAERGHQRLRTHHTSRARAAYFLDLVDRHIGRPGYCENWLHPEIRALEALCVGRGLDAGMGSRTTPECTRASDDEFARLPDESLDFVVARHDLPRHADPVRRLEAFKRIVRIGGRIGVVVPDHAAVDTYRLDAGHRSHLTRDTLKEAALSAGLRVDKVEVCMPNWSLVGWFSRL